LNRSRVYSNFEAWIWLLLRANHKDNKFMLGTDLITVKKGSMVTSQKKLCRQFRWGSTKLRNFLKVLEKDKMLLLKTNTQSTHITICNYDTYQDSQTANNTQTKRKQNANNTRTKTNNNVNNDNNVNKKIIYNDFIDLLENKTYLEKFGFDMLDEFVDYWTEKTLDGKKYKFQLEKTFEIPRRLNTWSKQDFKGTYKKHKEEIARKIDDEYYRKKAEDAVPYKDVKFQREEVKNLSKGIFKKI
jgi:hypothetical protein